jgi:hypothetical protein
VAGEETVDFVRHECGHLVVARALEFETGVINLKAEQAEAEITLRPAIRNTDDLKRFVERRVPVLYAGALAQSMTGRRTDAKIANGYLQKTANQDYAKAKELVRLHVGVERPDAEEEDAKKKLRETNERLYVKAQKLVEKHAPQIIGLSLAFMQAYGNAGHPREFTFSKERIDQWLEQNGGAAL